MPPNQLRGQMWQSGLPESGQMALGTQKCVGLELDYYFLYDNRAES